MSNPVNARVWQLVKELLPRSHSPKLCYTLRTLELMGLISEEGFEKARSHVTRQLGNHWSYESWVRVNHPEVASRMGPEQFLEGRLRWLDYLINESLAQAGTTRR